MGMDLLIKNGTVITAGSRFDADIAVTGGKISAVGTDIRAEAGVKTVDASGLYVLPGGIDVHTHLQMPLMTTHSADSYESGTRSAACGGVTTVFDYTLQEKGEGLLDIVKQRDALCAPSACVDYAFHTGISDVRPEVLEEMEASVKYGVSSFKVYLVYDFGVTDADLYRVLRRAKQVGALVTVHAENKGIIDLNVKEFAEQGRLDAWHHYLSRPEFVEEEADLRAIGFAKSLGAPLYLVHLANSGGMRAVRQARAEGYPVYAETCPQYLHFTSEVYKRPDGCRFICSPPIKGQESQDALWEGIRSGDIQTVATDHCPFQSYEKEWGRDDFRKAPNGCMGIENLYPYLLSEANQGRIPFEKAVELCSYNPARLFGCPDKGEIRPGADADIVLYDPNRKFTVTKSSMHSPIDYTIWEGTELAGYPVQTYLRGQLAYRDGEFTGTPGSGRFIKRRPIRLNGPHFL